MDAFPVSIAPSTDQKVITDLRSSLQSKRSRGNELGLEDQEVRLRPPGQAQAPRPVAHLTSTGQSPYQDPSVPGLQVRQGTRGGGSISWKVLSRGAVMPRMQRTGARSTQNPRLLLFGADHNVHSLACQARVALEISPTGLSHSRSVPHLSGHQSPASQKLTGPFCSPCRPPPTPPTQPATSSATSCLNLGRWGSLPVPGCPLVVFVRRQMVEETSP